MRQKIFFIMAAMILPGAIVFAGAKWYKSTHASKVHTSFKSNGDVAAAADSQEKPCFNPPAYLPSGFGSDVDGHPTAVITRCENGKWVTRFEKLTQKQIDSQNAEEERRQNAEKHRRDLVEAASTRILKPSEMKEFLDRGPSILVPWDGWDITSPDLTPKYNGLLLLQYEMKLAKSQSLGMKEFDHPIYYQGW